MRLYLLVLLTYIYFSQLPCYADWSLVYKPKQRTVKCSANYKDQILYIGTQDGIFKSEDGKSFENFGSEKIQKDENGFSEVNWIFIDDENKKIYIATSFGVYISDLFSPSWEKVFDQTKIESFKINSVHVSDKDLFISSNDGLWKCSSGGLCERFNLGLESDPVSGNYEVLYLFKDDELVLLTTTGMYKLDSHRGSWKKILNEIANLPDGRINARHLIKSSGEYFLSTSKGLYQLNSLNGPAKLISGIRTNPDGFPEAYFSVEFKGKIYVSSDSGVYEYADEKLKNISDGIRTKESLKRIYGLGVFKNSLYSFSDEGLFIYSNDLILNEVVKLPGEVELAFTMLQKLEPSIIEVQKTALKFSALPSDQDFKRYRMQARLRNIVPDLGVNLSSDIGNQYYFEGEKGISVDTTGSDFDSDLLRRNQRDNSSFNGLSIEWNASQLIYDDEINDLISQARLTANIRENLLDDITRLYFERRKLQLEKILSPASDLKSILALEMKIQELTGQLDSRTGGWFSDEIARRSKA